jgi:hypothetical protein
MKITQKFNHFLSNARYIGIVLVLICLLIPTLTSLACTTGGETTFTCLSENGTTLYVGGNNSHLTMDASGQYVAFETQAKNVPGTQQSVGNVLYSQGGHQYLANNSTLYEGFAPWFSSDGQTLFLFGFENESETGFYQFTTTANSWAQIDGSVTKTADLVVDDAGVVIAYRDRSSKIIYLGTHAALNPSKTAASLPVCDSAGAYFAFCGTDNNVYVYATGSKTALYSHAISSCSSSCKPAVNSSGANGKYLAVPTSCSTITLYNLTTGSTPASGKKSTFAGQAPVALSPDGNYLACVSTSGNNISVYNTITGSVITTLSVGSSVAPTELTIGQSFSNLTIGFVTTECYDTCNKVFQSCTSANSEVFTWTHIGPVANANAVTVLAGSIGNSVNVLANDSCSGTNNALTITGVTSGQHGTVTIASGGQSVLYSCPRSLPWHG